MLENFRRAHGGDWVVRWHPATGTPGTIYGTGLKIAGWDKNTLEAARFHANQLLADQAELLGLGSSTFQEVIGARMGRSWSFTFDQFFRGVPVIEGRVDVRINMSGVVAMMGSRAWPIPDDFGTVPAIDAQVAQAAAWSAMGGEPNGNAPAPRLVIWGDSSSAQLAPFALAWEVAVHEIHAGDTGRFGRYYVDAQNARVLHYQSDKHDCGLGGCASKVAAEVDGPSVTLVEAPTVLEQAVAPILTTVTVMAWTRTGADAFSALQNIPFAGLEVDVPGIGTVVTDDNGEFEIDINAPVTIAISGLDGRHHALVSGSSAPSGSVTVQPGVNATIQLLSATASSAQAAHTTASYWTDRTNEWARSILGNTTQLNTADNIGINVNISNTCNATYGGNNTNYYQAGGGCQNTAFSTVVAHEWGHGLDDRYGGISNSVAEGLSEGWGDIIGMYQVDSPILGSGFQTSGVGIRNGNNNRVWPYSSGVSPHGAGEVWMGWAWRFREALRASFGTAAAIQISEDLVLSSIVADATTREDAVLEVFIADDDDGNLLNGTPHYAELESASIQKGIPYPEIQVVAVSHVPLGNTTARLVPREVVCQAQEISETITGIRIVFDAGSGQVLRNMHPTGATDEFRAMLPGLDAGAVSYHIEVDHTGGQERLPQTGEYTYAIDNGSFSGFYLEDFESGAAGWTSGANAGANDWQLGAPDGDGGSPQGITWSDPSSAVSGTNVYGNDLGNGGGQLGNGRYQNNVNLWLRSPVIDCSGRTGVRLRFRRWLTVQNGSFDQASIWVNGQQVWFNPTGVDTVDTAWQTVEYLVPWADNNPSVQIEWRLVTSQGVNLGGWNLDDVEVGETIVPTADAELRFTPEQVVQGGAMNLMVTTPNNSRPYLLVIGDTIGPIQIPGFPIILAGGNYAAVLGTTDASGNDSYAFAAPNLPSTAGALFYSHVLTVDATFQNFVTSNRSVNWVTPTN